MVVRETRFPAGLLAARRSARLVREGNERYGRADMPDDLAYTLAKALDEHQDLFQWSNVTYSYNPFSVWKAFGVPLHPAAEKYYRERRYLK